MLKKTMMDSNCKLFFTLNLLIKHQIFFYQRESHFLYFHDWHDIAASATESASSVAASAASVVASSASVAAIAASVVASAVSVVENALMC